MATLVRSFVVYKDDDESSPEASSSSVVDPPSSQHPPSATAHMGPSLIVFAPDKENINPATGLRANAEQPAKKRKPGVLAVKSQNPPAKKSKALKEKETKKDSKKRSQLPSTSAPKSRSSGEKRVKRPVGLRKSAAPSRTRRSPSLPRVAEEVETEQERIAQSIVDARCYELTVLPLADLSKAYAQVPVFDDKLAVGDEKHSEKESSKVLEASQSTRPSTPEPSTSKEVDERRSSSPEPQTAVPALSTPERKKIYTSFTFSSPSPSSRRYAAARESSVDRFSDIDV